MKYAVSTLEGELLDAAVAKAEGLQVKVHPGRGDFIVADTLDTVYHDECDYSQNWELAGPIIERERITVSYDDQGGSERGMWNAYVHECEQMCQDFDSPLIAAMRAYVASKFGDEVDL